MDKLLLTLTLVAFSSGVLCNVMLIPDDTAQQDEYSLDHTQIESSSPTFSSTDPVMLEANHPGYHHMGTYNQVNTCRPSYQLPSGYVFTSGIGAYKLHKRKVKWNKARKSCQTEGGQLVILNTDAEVAVVTNWMKRENVPRVWLGIHNYFGDDEWVTLAGVEASGYDTWSPNGNQPDNNGGNEHCVTLGHVTGMYDDKCTEMFSYVCQINIC